jgi:hypothetical protein
MGPLTGWVGPDTLNGNSHPLLHADGNIIGMAWNSEAPYYTFSIDGGVSFRTPRRLVPASGNTHTYQVESIAAGEQGVWMATVVKRALAETDDTLFVVISKDYGKTWQPPEDVTSLLIDRPAERFARSFKVGYADNGTWVLFAGKVKTSAPDAETCWVRLGNDGTLIGTRQTLTNNAENLEIYSRPRAHEFMISYSNGSNSLARFSYDNGSSFEPPMEFHGVAATDGHGRWVLAGSAINIKYSADHGHTFQDVPAPTDPDLFQWQVASAAFSLQGEIVITAGARDVEMVPMLGYPPVPNLVTRATVDSWVWQPWAQFAGYSSVSPSYAVVANDLNRFVAAGYENGAPNDSIFVYYYQGNSPGPAGAADWQLFN